MTDQFFQVYATCQIFDICESRVFVLKLIFEICWVKYNDCSPLTKSWPSRQTSLHFEFCQTVLLSTTLLQNHLSAWSLSVNDCKSHWAEGIYVNLHEKFIKLQIMNVEKSETFCQPDVNWFLLKMSVKSEVKLGWILRWTLVPA